MRRFYSKFSSLLLIVLVVNACSLKEDIEFKGFEGFKLEKAEDNKLAIKLGFKILNPNFYSITIKPSKLNVLINDQKIGTAILDDRIKLIKKKEDTYFTKMGVDLEDGALLQLLKLALKNKVQLRINGTVTCSIIGISKKVTVDEVKEIDGAFLKMNQLLDFKN